MPNLKGFVFVKDLASESKLSNAFLYEFSASYIALFRLILLIYLNY